MRAPPLMVKREMGTASPGNELFDDLPPSPPPLPLVSEESGYENLNPVPPLQTQMRVNPPDQEMEMVPPASANEITNEPALKKSRTRDSEMAPPVSDTRDSEIRTEGTPSGCLKNIIPVSVYAGGEIQYNHMGASYSIPPMFTFSGNELTTYKDVTDEIYSVLKLSKELFSLNIQARYNGVSTGSFFFTLLAINDDKAWHLIYEMTVSGMNWRIIELYVNLVPNQTSQNDNPDLISSHGTSMHATPSQTRSFNYPTQAYWSRPQQVSNQACQNYNSNPTSLAGTSNVAQQGMPMHVFSSQTMPQGSCSRPIPIQRNFPNKRSRTQQNTPMHAKPSQTKPKPPLPQISELIILDPECDNLNPVSQSPRAVHETPDQLIKACQPDVSMNPHVSVTTDTGSTGDEQMEVSQIDTNKDDDSELIILEPECDNLNPATQSPQAVHETPDQLIKAHQPDVGMNPLVSVTTDTGSTGDEKMEVSQIDTNKDADYKLIILEPECGNLNPVTQSPQAVHETPDQLIKACQPDVGMDLLVSVTTDTGPTGDEQIEVSQIDTNKDVEVVVSDIPPTEMAPPGSEMKDFETSAPLAKRIQVTPSGIKTTQFYRRGKRRILAREMGNQSNQNDEGSSKKKYGPGKYTVCTNKCVVDVAMNFINWKVLNRLTVEHIKLLLGTPFLHLFVIPKGVIASNGILHEILQMWDQKDGCFKFGHKNLNFTANEVSLVMSLPNQGKNVSRARISTKKSVLRNRHFPNTTKITRSALEDAIQAALADVGCPAEEVVGLLIMYIFTTILFPQAGGNVPLHLFLYLDNVYDLHLYNWGQAVFDLLMMHIPTVSKWCVDKKSTEGHEQEVQITRGGKGVKRKKGHKQEKGQKYPSGYLPGCALALIVWFLEHAQMSGLKSNTGRVPRYLNWLTILSKNYKRRGFYNKLKEHTIALVNEGTLEVKHQEKKMIQAGFVASSHMFIICDEEQMKERSEKSIYYWLLEMVPVYMKFGVKPCEFLRDKFEKTMDDYVYVDKNLAPRDYLQSDEIQNMIVQFAYNSSRKVSSQLLSQKKSLRQSRQMSEKKLPIKLRKLELFPKKDMTQRETVLIEGTGGVGHDKSQVEVEGDQKLDVTGVEEQEKEGIEVDGKNISQGEVDSNKKLVRGQKSVGKLGLVVLIN